ncbi:phosphoribosylanthranilate isomerase [Campylobacter iguaniorum]|uniref:phosphoribosylanthranilate isomerase n=1 Tax=Campylobacter iguaniorum TaxID=1244531 RepID=UPI0007C93704|nr:phosphoribosylanthranilate isomerase [Campylobacter iguaniorum]ANE35402.1 phosphoribosylanthranilate isomerase [Campylobacter iguaniorum]
MQLKICGIKNEIEALDVISCDFDGKKVDYIGVIFAKSKRAVSKEVAKNIVNLAHNFGIKVVGVFADMSFTLVKEIASFCDLDVVQIYERVDDKGYFGCEVWQVFSVGDELPNLSGSYDLALFDTKGVLKGGNGVKFDWSLLESLDIKFGLAGGIGLENMRDAIKFKPYLLDINSKVEDENGIKDTKKINEILKIIYGS